MSLYATFIITAALLVSDVSAFVALPAHGSTCGDSTQQKMPYASALASRNQSIIKDTDNDMEGTDRLLNSEVAAQFKVVTCSATSCAKKRQALGLDEYNTFSAFYARAADSSVQVEEISCLGQCKAAPCVGIAHEEYDGTVALEGMTGTEFNNRVFQNIVDEEDADRVWSSVVNAIEVMSEQEEEEEA